MKWTYLLWGLLLGFAPLLLGLAAAEVDPHGSAAQLPWFAMITIPIGLMGGLLLALFS